MKCVQTHFFKENLSAFKVFLGALISRFAVCAHNFEGTWARTVACRYVPSMNMSPTLVSKIWDTFLHIDNGLFRSYESRTSAVHQTRTLNGVTHTETGTSGEVSRLILSLSL